MNDPRRVICPIFIVDIDATIQLGNKVELVLGNMEREIDHEIAAVDHRYGAEKAKPSIVLSQSLYTPFMFMPAAAVNSNDCRKFMNPVSFDNIII